MSEKRSRSGLLSRIAAPIAKAARRMARRDGIDEMSESDAEREMELARKAARRVDSDSLTSEDFRLAMEQVLREDQGRFGTKLHVVSLVEFREAVGERWARVSDKVMMIAEGVITKHLGSGNLFARQGTDFFTLVFRTCSADEGRIRAHTIAQELGTRLVGDQFQGIDRPLALSAEMDIADALQIDGTLNHPAIQRAVGEKRALLAGTVSDANSKSWVPPQTIPQPAKVGLGQHHILTEPVARKKSNDDLPNAITTGDSVQPAKDPGWVAMEAPKRQKEADAAWIILDTGPQQPQTAPSAPAIIPSAPPLLDTSRLTLLWRPTWMANPQTIGAYVARIQRQDKTDTIALDGTLAYPRADESSILTLDRYCIANAMRDFRASESAGNGSTVVVPIHWTTLAAENRMEYLTPFADITQDARAARVVIDLFGIPDQASARQMGEIIAIAKGLCREVMVRTRLTDSRAKLAADCGATMIGIDLSQLPPAERTDDAALLLSLRRFLEQASTFGLGAYLWGARRRAAVVGAVQGGFAMVNGPALMKDITKPAKVLPAPKARFTAMTG
ncbi:hypothetical protein [Magnetospirillum sulfuroxidans]|uniref:GGDEF domain-containing protein n=1 Tax=Magnetospirillum sulfuroxidans TaxID=611300 RepID=A0ABS5IDN5_9PROT|nr:hypothetical protein [Magnetospirillum sulfuroxidans]MBR9972454.1 hypothetical protein [Magnetospirillum sulfuroxidans]